MINIIKALNENPVYIKEIQVQERINSRRKFSLPPWIGYLTILLLPLVITLLLITLRTSAQLKDMKSAFVISIVIQTLYFIYRGASHAWSLIAKEKELKTFDNLISTALTPRDIVKGKFWASFYPLAKELTILLPVFVLIGFLVQVPLAYLFIVYILNIVNIFFFAMLGTYFSGRGKTAIEARNNSIRALAGLIFGTVFIGSLFSMLFYFLFPRMGVYNTFSLLGLLPLMLLYALNPISGIWGLISLIMSSNRLLQTELIFTGYICFNLLVYLVAGWVLYKKTVKRISEIPR